MTTLPIAGLVGHYRVALRAQGKSPRSVKGYVDAVARLERWLAAEGRSTAVGDVSKRDLEAWMVALAETVTRSGGLMRPTSVASYYRWVQQFFRWCVTEEEIASSPMDKMTPPAFGEPEVSAVSLEEFRALMATTAGSSRLEDRRDAAIISAFYDTGMRLDEMVGLRLDSLDLEAGTVTVLGKGSKVRTLGLGANTLQAVMRYCRARDAILPPQGATALWLTRQGAPDRAMKVTGISDMVKRRARRAGIRHVTPHQFRHGWASNMKQANIQLDEFKAAGGWASNVMPERYGRATIKARAVQTMKRLSPVDAAARGHTDVV
jgi:site-specific recombinase XerD